MEVIEILSFIVFLGAVIMLITGACFDITPLMVTGITFICLEVIGFVCLAIYNEAPERKVIKLQENIHKAEAELEKFYIDYPEFRGE